MALQLIDLSVEAEYIEIDAARVPYSFAVKLRDRTFAFTVRYNSEGGFYTVDMYDSNGNALAFGDPVRYGRALFNAVEDERFPIPVIIPSCVTDTGISEVTSANFGKEVKLYLHERRTE
jgi:hypothetical protein